MVDFHCHVSFMEGTTMVWTVQILVSLKMAADDFGQRWQQKALERRLFRSDSWKLPEDSWSPGNSAFKKTNQTNKPTNQHMTQKGPGIGRVKSDHPENWVPKYKGQSVNPSVKCCSTLIGHDMSTERNLGMLDSRYFQWKQLRFPGWRLRFTVILFGLRLNWALNLMLCI